jgi:RIO-like serine/threonine protein kinase
MTEDTWTTRDLPVLRAVVDIWDRTGDVVDADDVKRVVGLDKNTVQRALRALNTEPFFRDVTEVASGEIWMIGAPTGDALRVLTATEDADVAVMVGADGSDVTKTLAA